MSAYPILRLGDVANVVSGDPAPQDPGAFAREGPLFVRMQDVGRHHRQSALADSSDRLSAEWVARNRLRLFPRDSILIPKSGASVNLNHRAKLATEAYVVSHLAVVIPDRTRIDPDYLYWWSASYDPRGQAQVTSLPSLKLSTLKSATVPVPPLCDQRRIAGILNRAAKIVRLRKQVQERLQEFVPALFIKMFGDPVENPNRWVTEQLGNLITAGPQNGLYRPRSAYGSGTPILRINGFYDGSVSNPDGWLRLRLDAAAVNKYALAENDVVINRVNSRPFLGKSAMIPKIEEPAVFESNMMRIRLDSNRIDPRFLVSMLQLKSMRLRLCLNAKDAINQSSINQTDVCNLLVVAPPLDLQRLYTHILETVRGTTSVAEASSRTASKLSESLMSCLLKAGATFQDGIARCLEAQKEQP